jgi:NADH:ubiquinone oxidoreductase subunit K
MQIWYTGIVLVLALALFVSPGQALYDFEGFPLKTTAQGQVDGKVLQFTILGLQNSPRTLEFDVPDGAEIQWARTYVGVWGGTPRYTGWVQVSANDKDMGQVKLYGQDDKTQNVWCTGYGVYWTAWDTTKLVKNGHNAITATTSQGLPESKLDGRIYGMTTVIVVKTPGGADTRYWILEGNTNLHGEGWTSGANPTINDETSATISVPDLSGNPHANLSIIELTSTRGLPDYIQFNGKDLGSPVTDMAAYPAGAYDIADEMSYDNGYPGPDGKSIMARYWDSEIFDVTSIVKSGNNELKFLRGKDLNKDGTVSSTGDKPEGEDYLHPVFAMLTLERPQAASASSVSSTGSASGAGTDLAIGRLDVTDAFNGQTATITATLQNLGTRPSSPVTIDFSVDGASVASKQVTVDASGVQQVTATWTASSGPHMISASVQATGDRDTSNNAAKKEVTVGTLPDLSISVGAPQHPGSATPTQKSPLPVTIALSAALFSLGVFSVLRQRSANTMMQMTSVLFVLLIVTAGLPLVVPAVAATDATSLYLIPVTVNNAGGSDAAAFSVTIYLDGEKIATKTYDDGLGAGKEVNADIPIHTTPGSHTLKVVVDEAQKIRDGDRGNNVAESSYVFP